MSRVLVIDADASLRAALASALTEAGHEVEAASSGTSGLALARVSAPDVVVFDIALPDGDGVELCRAMRKDSSVGRAALLVLTAGSEEERRVAAFESGADDYLLKPHSMRELLLRVRALARRRSFPPPTEVLSVGALQIDRAARRVSVGGAPIVLTRREFDVLLCLADRAGRVQTRDALVATVWGEIADSGRVVDTTIKRLRRKLGTAGPSICTVRGVGYKLE
ncbi:MAG TPA: response regulator transcription factor [Labilithrix sp.]|nr:response regulator transcription factor [Labilithrix sp.]